MKSDSATAVAYINRIGGSILSLLEETKNIWNWCFSKIISISAVHIPDPNAVDFDAFSLSWNNIIDPYIFSPFSQTAKVLQKIEDKQGRRVLLVCPVSLSGCYALIDFPVKLPFMKDLLTIAHNDSRASNEQETVISDRLLCIQRYLQKKGVSKEASKIMQNRGGTPLVNSIKIHGELECIGVVNNMLIQLHQMK